MPLGNGVINLGSNADCIDGEDDDESNNRCTGEFSGQLADLNVWNRVLSDEELIRFTHCRPDLDSPVGNVLNWQNSIWKKTKVDLEKDFFNDSFHCTYSHMHYINTCNINCI